MEIMSVVGISKVNFTGNDGNAVTGTNLFVLCDLPYGEGRKSDKLFISDRLKTQLSYFPSVGDDIMVDFNRWGKVSNVTQVP